MIVLIALVAAAPADANIFGCDKPKEPYCLDFLRSDSDDTTMQLCEMDVDQYTRKMKDFIQCQNNETSTGIQEHKKLIERWNCHARRQTYCF